MALNIAKSSDVNSELVVLVVRAIEGMNVPKNFKVEVTKAPFHQLMGVDDGARMSRGDAAWHLAKSEQWSANMPVRFEILTLEEAQAEAEGGKRKADPSAGDGVNYAKMGKSELQAECLKQNLAPADQIGAMNKAQLLDLLVADADDADDTDAEDTDVSKMSKAKLAKLVVEKGLATAEAVATLKKGDLLALLSPAE